MRRLSKSRILSYRQCPKRLWLEVHRPELRDDSSSQQAFAIGHQVGAIAHLVYDAEGQGTLIDIGALGHESALALSAQLLAEGNGPIMEAGMTAEGALAYADVMLPDRSDGTLRWKMVEVKAATSVKAYYHDDIAVQAYIAAHSGTPLSSISIAHIDNRFVYQGDGKYQGLFREVDFTETAKSRFEEVRNWISGAQETLALTEEPGIAPGPQCHTPFACPFHEHCHVAQESPAYPLSSLPDLRAPRRALIEAEGIKDLRHAPDHLLTAPQLRVKQCSIAETPYFDAEGAATDLASRGFPAYFLDFEAVQFSVPIWKGTSPYQPYPFQFSLHVVSENGEVTHHSFLDLSGNDPRENFAQSLIELCGTGGPVFAYNASYEASIMRRLAAHCPTHASALRGIIARLVDLLPIAKNRYYHPAQHGTWGLKSVLPALCPDLSYADLGGVQDGRAAGNAYLEAINPHTSPERKAQLESELYDYCQLDTWAMVRIWQEFRGA